MPLRTACCPFFSIAQEPIRNRLQVLPSLSHNPPNGVGYDLCKAIIINIQLRHAG
jgi:hypothetical protein